VPLTYTSDSLKSGEDDKLFQQYTSEVKLLMDRYLEVMRSLSSSEGLDWTLGRELGGLKAFYQVQQDGSISACVHGLLHFSFFFLPPPPLLLFQQEDKRMFQSLNKL
jgi:hypothetical protein